MISIDRIKEQYPLHWLVWNNDYQELQELLQTEQVRILYRFRNSYQSFITILWLLLSHLLELICFLLIIKVPRGTERNISPLKSMFLQHSVNKHKYNSISEQIECVWVSG